MQMVDRLLAWNRFMRGILAMCLLAGAWPVALSAQTIIGIGTRYNDSYREWRITTDDDDVRGELWMRWSFRNDWTEWDLRLGDHSATIRQKWKDDPNLWEVQCDGVTVTARTAWPGEFSRWKLTDGTQQFNWQSKFGNQFGEWALDSPPSGAFVVYNYWEGDPREWVVVDELPENVSLAMRLAMIFLTVHFSSPRI
jgi:hypothetical protein